MSWIHIDDEVGILLWALDERAGQRRDQLDRAQPGHQPRVLAGDRRALDRPASVPVPGFVLDLKFGAEFGRCCGAASG
jgi:NAD dependent epimerase/dehydratase family enzyme